jgi:hypothetical protein
MFIVFCFVSQSRDASIGTKQTSENEDIDQLGLIFTTRKPSLQRVENYENLNTFG